MAIIEALLAWESFQVFLILLALVIVFAILIRHISLLIGTGRSSVRTLELAREMRKEAQDREAQAAGPGL